MNRVSQPMATLTQATTKPWSMAPSEPRPLTMPQASAAVNFLTMMLVGACLFGPDSLVAGAVAQDVGGPHAAGLATGFVNGLGSLGAILQAYVTVEVSKTYGWDALFIVFQLLAVVATLALLPFFSRRPSTTASR